MAIPQRNLISKLKTELVEKVNKRYMPPEEYNDNAPKEILKVMLDVKAQFSDVKLVQWEQKDNHLIGIYRIGSCEDDALIGRDYFVYIFQNWSERSYNPKEQKIFPPYANLGHQVLCGLTGPAKLKRIWQLKTPEGIFNYVTGRYHENAEILPDDIIDHLFFDFGQMVLLMKFMLPKFIK